MPTKTPWRAWLVAAFAAGVAPRTFWKLSLREWRAITGASEPTALNRARFAELAALYPDEKQ